MEICVVGTNMVGRSVDLIDSRNPTLNPAPTTTVDNIIGAATDLATGKFFLSVADNYSYLGRTEIFSGSLGAPGTVSLLLSNYDANYYAGVNSIAVDPTSHTLYYSYFDQNGTIGHVTTDQGIWKMPEAGGLRTQVVSTPAPVVASLGYPVDYPDELALDLPDSLIFYVDHYFDDNSFTYFGTLYAANVLTGANQSLISLPAGATYGIGGLAYDRNASTLYFSYTTPIPGTNQLLAATVKITGAGTSAAAALMNTRVLYSGTSTPQLDALAVDPATGLIFGTGFGPGSTGGAGVWVGQTNPPTSATMTLVSSNRSTQLQFFSGSSLNFVSSPVLPNLVSITRSNSNIVTGLNALNLQTYRLQLKTNLVSGSWASISGVADLTVSNAGVAYFTHTNAINLGKVFYRVGLLP